MAEIRFENVTKHFGQTPAVNNFSLDVADKEFLVLVGPSGCGKSTILRLLSGLEEPDEGIIFIGGKPVNNIPPRDRNIAMVFQTYALYPHMSVRDNMSFGLSLHKVPKKEIQERVDAAARILGIEDLLKRKPRQLSGGQRQRVALGRAIVREPAAFLLDEPLSNLDAKLRVQTRAELNKLHQRLGTTFVYVTHDQTEAMTMATRIAVLNEGRLQQVGKPRELYEKPVNLFVAGFIGSPAMNIFRAEVLLDPDGTFLSLGEHKIKAPPEKTQVISTYAGKEIILGIRPENIYTTQFLPQGISQTTTIKARVDLTEMMGNELFIYGKISDQIVMARVDSRTQVNLDDEIDLVLNTGSIYLFDPETKKSIYSS
jgi:multiple sugar transport system ATP-binding protein